ncbi:phosphoethanolamine transferase domain-containing protein [Acinetobacter sp.]|uniref:phosphoethanolamine transferase domain-containing protein n=1 Tax=Acinetobacter sp. TaxID=472 RepID=UPI0028352814|nr:phosphoethanolamine transferase domain-containing protein [Acinetobacter sp.]MDR0236066.1 phosphoethanolamine transferase domain-containing protein [Acinetobacter sp.]
MQKNISSTMFYSLIFAMGGAPTIAMLIIQAQTTDPAIISQALLGLSVMIACILVPIVLIQNAFLFFKRNDQQLEQKIIPLKNIYLVLNVICLVYWLMVQFL